MKVLSYWSKLSLGSKIASLTSLLIMLVIVTLTYLSIQRERLSFQSELTTQATLLLETIPLTMRDQIYRMELDEITDMARLVSNNEAVTKFIIYDQYGVILVDSTQTGFVIHQEVDPLGQRLIQLKGETIYTEWQKDQLVVGDVIMLGNQPIGGVSAGLSTAPLQQKIADLTRQSILLALITLVIGVGSSFLLARQITTPLDELTSVAAEMAQGNLTVRVALFSRDEIGRLRDSFNQMAGAIQKRESELRELAASLEQTVAERTAELREQNVALEKMAVSDPLTGIYNRRHFFELAEKEIQRSRRYGHSLSIAIIDLDDFKRLNDTFGHMIGDQILVGFTQLCQQNLRSTDILARYGGDEFVIMMPEVECNAARQTAERLRKLVLEEKWPADQDGDVQVTISLGVTCFQGKGEFSFDELISQADQAMYTSKKLGRNRVTVWGDG